MSRTHHKQKNSIFVDWFILNFIDKKLCFILYFIWLTPSWISAFSHTFNSWSDKKSLVRSKWWAESRHSLIFCTPELFQKIIYTLALTDSQQKEWLDQLSVWIIVLYSNFLIWNSVLPRIMWDEFWLLPLNYCEQ